MLQTPKTALYGSKQNFFTNQKPKVEDENLMKKRKSFDVSNASTTLLMMKKSSEESKKLINLEEYIDAEIRLLEFLLAYLKNLDLVGVNDRWNS